MTQNEVNDRIALLQKLINELQNENTVLKKEISDLEDGSTTISEVIGEWEKTLSECFDVVNGGLKKVSPHSNFRTSYLDEYNAILSGQEAGDISNRLCSLQSNVYQKIEEIEDRVRKNSYRISQYQDEVNQLRVLQMAGAEMNG